MKNKISDLRNHMFQAMERLNNEDLAEDQLKLEISRAQAISEVGKVIVDSAKTEVMFAKLTKGNEGFKPTGFLNDNDREDFTEQKNIDAYMKDNKNMLQ